ncbi:MAG: DoxX family protein [Verrucomicrobiota bacterium]|nr:DoxX family protein [Verrucomicrobiota bacterium]
MMEKFENPFLEFISSSYNWLVEWSSNCQSLLLLWMRLTWGHQFFLAGSGKLANIDQTVQFFSTLCTAYPYFCAHLVGYLELIGGLLLMVGLASRLVTIPLIITMIVALTTAHSHILAHFRFLTHPSAFVNEGPYPYLITCLLVLVFGPGRFSLDAWIKRWAHKQKKY